MSDGGYRQVEIGNQVIITLGKTPHSVDVLIENAPNLSPGGPQRLPEEMIAK